MSDNSNIWNLVLSSAGSCSCHFEPLWTWSACSSLCTSHVLAKVFVCFSLRPNIKLPFSRESELSSGRPLGTLLIWVNFFFLSFSSEEFHSGNGNSGVKSLWWLDYVHIFPKIRFWVCFKVVYLYLFFFFFFCPVLLSNKSKPPPWG